MKKKLIQENNDLIQLTEKGKNSNKKILGQNIEIFKLKVKNNEETKSIINRNIRDGFNNNIITILRVRPENAYEKSYSNIKIIKIESTSFMKLISPIEYNYFLEGTKFLNEEKGLEVTKTKEYSFQFDHIFDNFALQNQVYEYSAEFLVRNIFEGFNSTIFAYGSIGSGKTYTMFGTNDKPGIIIRSINQIFTIMNNKGLNSDYDLQISYYKIYNETIVDLLPDNKGIKQAENNQISFQEENINKFKPFNLKNNFGKSNKSFFMEITKKVITSQEEAYQILSSREKNKLKLIKGKNNSSKAHYIVEINIVNNAKKAGDNNGTNKYGKFILIDLAGFEKVAKIKPNTDNFYVNKSLFTLSTCINGLLNNNNKNYIPWRDSKLTMILKDYLSGNSKIVMIANISPSLSVIEETFSTLNFAKKIKRIKTNAQKNLENEGVRIDKFDSIITSLKDQISNVKKEISKNEKLNNSMVNSFEKKNDSEDEEGEINGNEILEKCVEEIKEHFNKEIELNKQINDVEFNITKINKENYFNQVNNKINKSNIKKDANKLNDYQLTINSLYTKKHQLIQKRKNIQMMISKESKKDNNLGKYLMYVYKYYINLINQLQSKNRQNKIDVDKLRKDDQISNLTKQIQIRDDFLQDMTEKVGSNNISFNLRRLIKLEELSLDPCLNISLIKKEEGLKKFGNGVILSSEKKLSRNISMPLLKNTPQSFKNFAKNNALNNNKILPKIQKKNNYYSFRSVKNDSSIFQKRIPSGFILRNKGKGNNLRNNFYGQYQKYYNLYHISNNYHVGDFHHENPNYIKNKNPGKRYNSLNKIGSSGFENYYEDKVKTILNKNYISRYNNSPYSLENI